MRSVQRFEEDLIDHGFHFLKIYLSVSKEEQARRFEEREENPLKQWKLSEIDMQMQSRWEEFTQKKYQYNIQYKIARFEQNSTNRIFII